MRNIIKGVDFGMGYEHATKWEPGLQCHHPMAGNTWGASATVDQADMDRHIACGHSYRRPLPILANHPEAIPLEPGEVLQVGDRGLTRDGRDTGELEQSLEEFYVKAGLTLHSRALNRFYKPDGYFHVTKTNDRNDIIARLPKVAKEAELPKLEIVVCGAVPPDTIVAMNNGEVVGKIINVKPEAEKAKEEKVEEKRINVCGVLVTIPQATELYQTLQANPEVQAEVKRQEEAKRIGPGDWVWNAEFGMAFMAESADQNHVFGKWTTPAKAHRTASKKAHCRKIENPDLIAALNAEIDAKAGG